MTVDVAKKPNSSSVSQMPHHLNSVCAQVELGSNVHVLLLIAVRTPTKSNTPLFGVSVQLSKPF